jgi:hypothetical protein
MLSVELEDHLENDGAVGTINRQQVVEEDDADGYIEGDAGHAKRSGGDVRPGLIAKYQRRSLISTTRSSRSMRAG